MEPNIPVVAKRLWSIVRVLFYMLRKGISKGKLMVDLNLMMKRGKIAGKAIHNLMFHHHASSSPSDRRSRDGRLPFEGPQEYEFSCSNTPSFPFHLSKRKNHHHHSHFFACAHAPPTEEDDLVDINALREALEMINSEAASPALPGFGRTPMVRQLRVTDSPFPLRDIEDNSHVDEAAEEFIKKFYRDLRRQNRTAG